MVGSCSDADSVAPRALVVPMVDEARDAVICAPVNACSGERGAGVYAVVDWHDSVPGAELTRYKESCAGAAWACGDDSSGKSGVPSEEADMPLA